MSAEDYLPDTVESPIFVARTQPGGIYERLEKIVANMDVASMANAEVDRDFFRRSADSWSANYGFRNPAGQEFSANVFGEILGEKHGTFLGAKGNHYPGPNEDMPKIITDGTKIKPSIVIGQPTKIPETLADVYYDQLCTFNTVRESDRQTEAYDGETFERVKEITKAVKPGQVANAIILMGGLLYTTHADENGGSSRNQSPAKKPLKKRKAAAIDDKEDSETAVPETKRINEPLPRNQLPGRETVRVGAFYDPRVFPDYGGPVFSHRLAQVIQPDWRDSEGNLIPPWAWWDVLRPGTLIMASVSIVVWVIGSGENKKKVYHAVIQSLRVVDRSGVQVKLPVPKHSSVAVPTAPATDSASQALKALQFSLPASSGSSEPPAKKLHTANAGPATSSASAGTSLSTENQNAGSSTSSGEVLKTSSDTASTTTEDTLSEQDETDGLSRMDVVDDGLPGMDVVHDGATRMDVVDEQQAPIAAPSNAVGTDAVTDGVQASTGTSAADGSRTRTKKHRR
ncbi:hypothetical protein VNI00_004394 [Paramarasmius palmivorus]|uniref:Uncharacterized protein n=1 Tax=Paramarasmius palmivorus TaxID=297713 RepID=A0AAW0DP31_9AGAR